MTDEPSLVLAKRFFKAYNSFDIETISELLSDDLHWEHHGRFKGQGKEKLLELMQGFHDMIPGRHYDEPTRWAVNGDIIFIEHKAGGTPVVDIDMFGWKAGEPFVMDFCTLLVVKNGKILEWSDYA